MVGFSRNGTNYGSTGTEQRSEPPLPRASTPTPSPPGGWFFGFKSSGNELPHPNGGRGSEPARSQSTPSLLWMAWKYRHLFVPLITLVTVLAGLFRAIPGMPEMPLQLDCGDPFDIYNCTLKWGQGPPSEHQPKPEVAPLRLRREIVNLESRWQWEDEEHEALFHEWDRPEHATRHEDVMEHMRHNGDLFWGHVEAHSCKTSYGTREYSAVLMNLPTEWGMFHDMLVEACEITPLEIHGAKLIPKSCDDKGNGVVIGLWEIDQFETDCKTVLAD